MSNLATIFKRKILFFKTKKKTLGKHVCQSKTFFIDKLINVLITKKPRGQRNQYTGCSLWVTKGLYKKQGQGHKLGKHSLSIKDFYYFFYS